MVNHIQPSYEVGHSTLVYEVGHSIDLPQVYSVSLSNRSLFGCSWIRHSSIPSRHGEDDGGMAEPLTSINGTVRRTEGADLQQV